MTIVVRSLSDQTYEIVRRQILQGVLAPGMPVRQDIIASGLGISKIPLREALGRLEQDGLLCSYPNRGYVVRAMSADEAGEVFSLRLRLEPRAAAEACRRSDREDQRRAMEELTALEAEQDKPGADHVSFNRCFHMSLIKPGGPIAYQLIERLHVVSERYVRAHLAPQGREARARQEHRDILAAWISGDAPRIEALLTSHIQGTLADLQEQLSAG
jgi:DNA-binding GntR family transcriptional regulator